MKSPFVINNRGQLILRKLHDAIRAVLEASKQARERANKRAKLVALAKLALKYGEEGVDYYV